MASHENIWAVDNALHHFSAPVSAVQPPGLSGHTFGMQDFRADSAPQGLLPAPSCQGNLLHSEDNTDNFQKHPTSSSPSRYSDHSTGTQPTKFIWDTEVVEPLPSNLLNLDNVDADRIQESLPSYLESRQSEPDAFEEDMSWTSDILSTDSKMNLDDQSFETDNKVMAEQREASLADELLFSDPITEDSTEQCSTQNSSTVSQQSSQLPQLASAPADESIDLFKATWQDTGKTDSQLATSCRDSLEESCNSLERDQLVLSRVQQQVLEFPSLSEQFCSGSSTTPSQDQNISADMPEDFNMQDREDVCMDDLSVPQKPSGNDPSNIQSVGFAADLSFDDSNKHQHNTGNGEDSISNTITCTSNRVTESLSDVQIVTEQHTEGVINPQGILDEVESQVDKDQCSLQDRGVLECDQTEAEQTEMINSVPKSVQSQSNPEKENEQDVDGQCKDRSIGKQDACSATQPSVFVVTQPTEIDRDDFRESTSSPLSEGSIMFLSDIDDDLEAADEEQDVQNKGDTENMNDNADSILFKATEHDSTTCVADEPSHEDPEDDRRCESRMSGDSPGDVKSSEGVDDARRRTGNVESSEAGVETKSGQSHQDYKTDTILLENKMQCRDSNDAILSDASEDIQNDCGRILNVGKETAKDGEKKLGESTVDNSVQKVPEIKTAGQESLEDSTSEVCDLISDDEKEGYKGLVGDDYTINGQDTSKQCESGNKDDQSLREGCTKNQEDADIMLQERDNVGEHDGKEDNEDDIQDGDSVAKDQEKDNTICEQSESEHKDRDDLAKPREGDGFVEHSKSRDGNLAKDTATGSDCLNSNPDVNDSQEPICLSDSDEEQSLGSVCLEKNKQSADSASEVSEDNQIAQSHAEKKESDSTVKGNKEAGQEESDDDVLVIEDDTSEVISVDDSSDEDDSSTGKTTGSKNVKAANEGKKISVKSDWSCQICGNSNKSLNSLKLHVRRSHNLIMVHRKEEMKCKMCSFTGTWQKIKEHIIKDHQTPLKWYVKNQATTEITKLPASALELPEDSLLAQPVLVDPNAKGKETSSSSGSNKQIYLIKKVTSIEAQSRTDKTPRGPGRPPLAKSLSQPSRVPTTSKPKSYPATSVFSRPTKSCQQIAPKSLSSSQPIRDPTISSPESTPVFNSVLSRPTSQNYQPSFLATGTITGDSAPSVKTMTILTARPDTDLHDKRRAVVNRELSAKVREVFQQQSVGGPPVVTKISGTTYMISSANTKELMGAKALPVRSLSVPSGSPVPLHKNIAPKPQEAAKPTPPQQGQAAFMVRSVATKKSNVLSIAPLSLNRAVSAPVVMPCPDTVANQQPFQMEASTALINAATLYNVSPLPESVVPAIFNHEYCKRTVAPAVLKAQHFDTIKTTAAHQGVTSTQPTSIGPHIVHADSKAKFSRLKDANITTVRASISTTSNKVLDTSSLQSKASTPAGPPMVSYMIKVPKAPSNRSSKEDGDGPSYLVKVPVNQTNVSKKLMVHLPVDKKSKVKHAVCIVQPPLHTNDSAANLPVVGKLPQSTPKADTPSLVTDIAHKRDSINSRISALATSPLSQSIGSRSLVDSQLSGFVEPSELVANKAQHTVPVFKPMFEPVGDPLGRASFLARLKEPALGIQLLKSQFEDTNTFKAADFIKIDERVQYECARCKEFFPQLMLLQLHHIDCTTHPPAGKILPIVHIPTAMLASFFNVSTSGYSSACTVCSTLLLGNARNVEDQQDFSSHLSKHAEPSVAITCLDDTRKLGILQTRMTSQQAKEWVDFIAPPFKMGNKPTSTQEGNLEEFINTTGILHQESMLLRRRSRRNLPPEHYKRQSKHKHKKHKHKHRHSRDHELNIKEYENSTYLSSVKTQEGCEGEWTEPSPKGSSSLFVRKKSRPGALKQSITSSPSQPKPQLHNLTPVKKKSLTPSKVRQRFLNVSVPGRRSLRGLGLDFGLGLMMLPLERKKRKEKSPNSEDRQTVTDMKKAKTNSSSQSPDLNKDEVIEILSSGEEMVTTLPFDEQRTRGHTSSTSASPIDPQKCNLEEPDDLETKKWKGNSGELSASDVDSDKEKMNVDGSDSKDANYSDNMEGEDSSSDDAENANENRSNVDNSEREIESDREDARPTDLPLTMIALHYQRVNKDIAIGEMEDDDMDSQPSTSKHSVGLESEAIDSKDVDNTLLEGTSSSQCQQASPCPSEVVPCIRSCSSTNDDILLDSEEEGKMPLLERQLTQTEQVVDIRPLRVEKISGEPESKSPTAESAAFNFDQDRDLGEREDREGHTSKILENQTVGESEDVILEDTTQHGRNSQDSFPTSRSLGDFIQDDNSAQAENSHEDHSTRLDSSSGDSCQTKQSLIEDFQQEDSSISSSQQVIDLEDSFPTNTSLEDEMVLDGSLSPRSITEENADDRLTSFEEGSEQPKTSFEIEFSKNSAQGDDFPQEENSYEQDSNSKGGSLSCGSLEAVIVEDTSMNSFQEDSNSADSFPTDKSPEDDFLSEDTGLNSFQQISNFLEESIPERGEDSFQLATSLPIHRSSEQELFGAVDGANHANDILDLNTSGDEITGDWILEDSVSSTSNPDENHPFTNPSEVASQRSPVPNETISDDFIEEGGTQDGTHGSQPDVETSESSTQSLVMKEKTQPDKTVPNISKRSQNESPLAESNLSDDGDNVQDIFLDNESKSSFGDGFDVEDWEEEDELSKDEVVHLSNNHDDDDAILDDISVEVGEAPLSVMGSRSSLTGDKPQDTDDDLTPMSNAIHSHLKAPQSVLHSEEEEEEGVRETVEMEESQARPFNNLKRKSESFGDATLKRSRVEGTMNEGVSGTDF